MRLISALFTLWLSEAVHGKGAERFRLFKSLDLISIIIYSTIFWCDGFCWGPFWQFYVPFRIVFWSLYFQFSKPCPHFQATFFTQFFDAIVRKIFIFSSFMWFHMIVQLVVFHALRIWFALRIFDILHKISTFVTKL